MRYSRLEKYGNTAFANDALYNSQSHVKTKADPSKSNPFRTKKKELKAGPNGIVYYNVAKNVVAILVPETHPLFNYPLLVHGAGVYKQFRDTPQTVKFHLVDMLKNFAKQIVT